MTLSRRQMCKLSVGVAATWITGMGPSRSHAAAAKKKVPIGLELWSVRHQCEKELPSVLRAVGKMGYDSVEMLRLLDGYIDIYMPDAKYWDDSIAEELSSASNTRK